MTRFCHWQLLLLLLNVCCKNETKQQSLNFKSLCINIYSELVISWSCLGGNQSCMMDTRKYHQVHRPMILPVTSFNYSDSPYHWLTRYAPSHKCKLVDCRFSPVEIDTILGPSLMFSKQYLFIITGKQCCCCCIYLYNTTLLYPKAMLSYLGVDRTHFGERVFYILFRLIS